MRAALTLILVLTADLAAAQRRPVTVDDQFRFADVGDPQISPDGEWVLYTVTTHRRRRRPAKHRHLEGEVGRIRAQPGDVLTGERERSALEP